MLNSADEKDGALVEALRLYGGPGQRVLVFVAMKKQCDAETLEIIFLTSFSVSFRHKAVQAL